MTIVSAASAFPPYYYPQQQLLEGLKKEWEGRLENPRFLDRLHAAVCVDGRHLSMPIEQYYSMRTWGEANSIWIDTAKKLGCRSISEALARAGLTTSDVGALFFVSVTGIAAPSIDARLINIMGLPVDMRRVPIFGLGCVAGASGIAMASDYVKAYPDKVAVLLSVELCTLTIQKDDLSTANMIAAGLFGDGACAVVVAGAGRKMVGPRVVATRPNFYPGTESVMGWDISEKGFQIVLSQEVPEMVTKHFASNVKTFLADYDLTPGEIGSWILHTGGPKVLEATQSALGLPSGALDTSWECLRRTGNLSSASVLVVLEEFLMNKPQAPGSYSVLAAMGPGFCAELVLLQW